MTAAQNPETRACEAERMESVLREIDELPRPGHSVLKLVDPKAAEHAVLSGTASAPAIAGLLERIRTAQPGADESRAPEDADFLPDTRTVAEVLLAIEFRDLLENEFQIAGGVLDYDALWVHSLAVGCAASLLAADLDAGVWMPGAFACGLLHDVGKAALMAALPKGYARVTRQAAASRTCVCDIERDILGVDHTIAGRRLALRWKLPVAVRECAWLHHQPPGALMDSVSSKRLVAIVCLADNLVKRQRIDRPGPRHVEPLADVCRDVDIPQPVLENVERQLPGRLALYKLLTESPNEGVRTSVGRSSLRADVELGAATSRLNVQSRCLEVLSRFGRALSPEDDVMTVCQHAAEAVRTGFGLSSVATFARAPGSRVFPVVLCLQDSMNRVSVRAAVGTDRPDGECAHNGEANNRDANNGDPNDGGQGNGIAAPRLIGDPPGEVAPIVAAFRSQLGANPDRITMLALVHADRWVGGVLLARPEEESGWPLGSGLEAEALSAGLGLGIASAMARAESAVETANLLSMSRHRHAAQGDLLRRRSVEIVAKLAAGAAHELNNPLAVIAGRAQLLRRDVPDAETQRVLDIIDDQARQASLIVAELMRFAKPEPPRPESVSLADWANRLRHQWERQSNLHHNKLTVEISDRDVRMFVDVDQLTTAADAIIANAIEATTPENARLVINSASVASDETVVVAIGDNGIGMSPDVMAHAMDPFFSHRPAGRGRGLGLSHACRLVENNGGSLWIESAPGDGTTVYLSLPARGE